MCPNRFRFLFDAPLDPKNVWDEMKSHGAYVASTGEKLFIFISDARHDEAFSVMEALANDGQPLNLWTFREGSCIRCVKMILGLINL